MNSLRPSAPHIMILEATDEKPVTDEMTRGAIAELAASGASFERFAVPGVFELPAALKYAIRSMELAPSRRRFDGYLALGCVIRDRSADYDHIGRECSRGLQQLAIDYALALGFGVLMVDKEEQAARLAAVDEGNKGAETARNCLSMVELKRHFKLFPRLI